MVLYTLSPVNEIYYHIIILFIMYYYQLFNIKKIYYLRVIMFLVTIIYKIKLLNEPNTIMQYLVIIYNVLTT